MKTVTKYMTYLELMKEESPLRPTIAKKVLIKVAQGKSYILLLFSLFLLMIISKHYSTYTLFTAFVSKTVFVYTNSS